MKCLRSKKRLNAADYTTRKGTRRSEKAKVSEEALLSRSSKAKKPMNACVHTYTKSQTPTRRHMLGPERPEAVPLDRALYLPTFSHLLIVNKQTSLSRCSFEIQYAL